MSSTNIRHARLTAFLRGFPAKNGSFSAVLSAAARARVPHGLSALQYLADAFEQFRAAFAGFR